MIYNYFGDRFRQRNMPYEDSNRDRLTKNNAEPKAVYVCLDQIVNPDGSIERPRTDFGIGNPEKIKELGAKYEKKKASYVMLTFHDVVYDRNIMSKIYIQDDHEEIDSNLLGYINRVKSTVTGQIKKDKPDSKLGIIVSVHYCNDKVILNRIKKNVKAEEIVSYEY